MRRLKAVAENLRHAVQGLPGLRSTDKGCLITHKEAQIQQQALEKAKARRDERERRAKMYLDVANAEVALTGDRIAGLRRVVRIAGQFAEEDASRLRAEREG